MLNYLSKSNVNYYYNFIPQTHTSYEWRNFVETLTLFRSPVFLIRITGVFYLSRYLWAVKLPPQNSAGAKKLSGSRANNQWWMKKTPTD
ncbi:hypothetical protein BW900_09070 [Bacillus mycoides]|uniref:Uncharacterized protein n=1 Tax=Bacillus mycoides TaxID=1405 RepID=A0A1S9TB78_BACMY|nr:hypothetical protein BW900_09070 [Bacillus mycoides]